MTRTLGFGAQFGGTWFCHAVRVVRLPRHGGSLPIAIAVSCSADRQAKARIDADGVWLEELETDAARFLPDVVEDQLVDEVVRIDLDGRWTRCAPLSRLPVTTRVSLTGPVVVARDIAHAEIAARLDRGEPMPDYPRDHAVYDAGPAKTPEGMPSGSFGPTTGGRMDGHVERFQAAGGRTVVAVSPVDGSQHEGVHLPTGARAPAPAASTAAPACPQRPATSPRTAPSASSSARAPARALTCQRCRRRRACSRSRCSTTCRRCPPPREHRPGARAGTQAATRTGRRRRRSPWRPRSDVPCCRAVDPCGPRHRRAGPDPGTGRPAARAR
jgi:tartrate dehydratase beta subunit/fumarate hydratase class I family protein